MQKLHLVGFTTDQKGLILSARRGARSGTFHLSLDDSLAEAVEALRSRQAALADADMRAPRAESALPVREIQARLRQGRTVQDVAKAAGVEPAWVERFAPPVYAEQAQVIAAVQGATLSRSRLGPSSHPIGDALRRNLAERGMALTPEEFSDAWSTRQLADGRWAVRFRFHHRSKDEVLRFDLDDVTGAVVAADHRTDQLGYVPGPTSVTSGPAGLASGRAAGPRPSAKRATVTTGFRRESDTAKAVSRPAKERERANAAMRQAAARKAKEREALAARQERAARAEEVRKVRELAAAERAKVASAQKKKAAAAKKAAAEKSRRQAARQAAAQARRAEAALVAAERAKADERAEAKRATSKAAKKGGVKRAVAKTTPAELVDPANGEAPSRPLAQPQRTRPLRAI